MLGLPPADKLGVAVIIPAAPDNDRHPEARAQRASKDAARDWAPRPSRAAKWRPPQGDGESESLSGAAGISNYFARDPTLRRSHRDIGLRAGRLSSLRLRRIEP